MCACMRVCVCIHSVTVTVAAGVFTFVTSPSFSFAYTLTLTHSLSHSLSLAFTQIPSVSSYDLHIFFPSSITSVTLLTNKKKKKDSQVYWTFICSYDFFFCVTDLIPKRSRPHTKKEILDNKKKENSSSLWVLISYEIIQVKKNENIHTHHVCAVHICLRSKKKTRKNFWKKEKTKFWKSNSI